MRSGASWSRSCRKRCHQRRRQSKGKGVNILGEGSERQADAQLLLNPLDKFVELLARSRDVYTNGGIVVGVDPFAGLSVERLCHLDGYL